MKKRSQPAQLPVRPQSKGPTKLRVQIIKRGKVRGIDGSTINSWVRILHKKLLRHLPQKKFNILKSASELTIVFVSTNEGRQLNKQFRKKNYATDVLSFSSVVPNSLGELVFCMPVLARQAGAHGLTLKEETLYMLIHGLLHLLGYDHEQSRSKARTMFKLQDELFAEMTTQ